MSLVVLLCADLMFGSRVGSALQLAGDEVETIASAGALEARLARGPAPAALVVDLTDEGLGGARAVGSLISSGSLAGVPTLGFYSHVDVAAREAAREAGFDRVIPRSRMAREGAALVAALIAA